MNYFIMHSVRCAREPQKNERYADVDTRTSIFSVYKPYFNILSVYIAKPRGERHESVQRERETASVFLTDPRTPHVLSTRRKPTLDI